MFIPDKRRKEGLAFEKDMKRRPSKRQSFNLAFQKCHSYKRSGLSYEPQVVDNVCNKVRSKYRINDVYVIIKVLTLLTTCVVVPIILLNRLILNLRGTRKILLPSCTERRKYLPQTKLFLLTPRNPLCNGSLRK